MDWFLAWMFGMPWLADRPARAKVSHTSMRGQEFGHLSEKDVSRATACWLEEHPNQDPFAGSKPAKE